MIDNPVFRKETLGRYRLKMSPEMRVAVVTAMAGAFLLLYASVFLYRPTSFEAGRQLYLLTMGLQMVILNLSAPALFAGAISQEHEQQTWDMLLASQLKPSEILYGKLLARSLPLIAVLLIGMPIAAAGWYLARPLHQDWGSGELLRPISDFWINYLSVAAVAAFHAAFAFRLSFQWKRTQAALLGSYGLLIGGLYLGSHLLVQTVMGARTGTFDFDHVQSCVNPIAIFSSFNIIETKRDILFASHTIGMQGALTLGVAAIFLVASCFRQFKRTAYER